MVLLFSFVATQVFAIADELESEYEYITEYDRLTRHFKVNHIEVESYAQVYVSEYYVNDCDMGARTWAKNFYVNDAQMDSLYTHAAYVSLYAVFESGLSGEIWDYDESARGENNADMILSPIAAADVSDDDYLVAFDTYHKIYIGVRGWDITESFHYGQIDGSNTIHIFKCAD